MKTTVYSRSKGVVCFEANLFTNREILLKFPALAAASGLNWCWASLRTKPPKHGRASLPKRRPLTALDERNGHLFIEDYSERSVDGDLREIFLIGSFKTECAQFLERNVLDDAISRFINEDPSSPIVIAIVQLGDSRDLVYVPVVFDTAVSAVLSQLGLTQAEISEKRKYDQLRSARLEVLKPNLIEIACASDGQ